MLVTVLIGHHDIDLISEDLRQFLVNEAHLQALVDHLIAIKLKSEKPWADSAF